VVVVVVDCVLVVASAAGLAEDIADESAGGAADIAEVSAGLLVVVVVVSVVVVAEVSAFFWQAPRPQAKPSANITAAVVCFVIGSPPGCAAETNTEA
jgi:high-affinity nickel permease